ncbi:hypothetical protein [Chryseobacterium vrystaatense]|uniref:Lipoprotein n=1 Tax=Chryseobacterium vrystaatense TaxID=307480 RepID=A0ABR4UPU6_9FLAO|nr:hypothetical protein [Chryseobacterium vrystaatense]KFF27133.1 hypothetical protein IW16_07715 [Chryseobacterium vrystaatense]
MKKLIPSLFLFLVFLCACKKDKTSDTDYKNGTATKITAPIDTVNNHLSQQQPEFLKNGKKPSDLVPEGYEIQYDTEGDLNQDGWPDMALVIRKKEDTLARRKMLILLRNSDKTYRLDKISETAFPDEYNEAGYKMNDTEDISINKGELSINLYDIGPNGNLFSTFKYLNGDLILTYIETYNMGAGSHSALYYEPMKGKLIQETMNTMEEEMPSKSKTIHLKKERFLFEKTSPDKVIQKAYGFMHDE